MKSGQLDGLVLKGVKAERDYINDSVEEGVDLPLNEVERSLVDIWSKILDSEDIRVNAGFIDMGGNSLRAFWAISCILDLFGVDVSISEFFENPTIAKLAKLISSKERSEFGGLASTDGRNFYPASSQQCRLYALQQLDQSSTAYNLPFAYELQPDLCIDRLRQAVIAVIDRHEALRTRFEFVDGRLIQIIDEISEFELVEERVAEEGVEAALKRLIRPFDLSKTPCLRMRVLRGSSGDRFLFVDMHHVSSDRLSSRIFIEDLLMALKFKSLDRLPLGYKDYSVWQQEGEGRGFLEKQRTYWLNQFDCDVPLLSMPTDYQRPAKRDFRGANIEVLLGEGPTSRLREFCRDQQVTLFMALFACYSVTLSKYTGQDDIVVGSSVSGRDYERLGDIVGMFANTLALRSRPRGEKRFDDYMTDVRSISLGGFDNQQYPLEELVDEVCRESDPSRNPLFDTMFDMVYIEGEERNGDVGIGACRQLENPTAKFDLTLTARELDGEIELVFEYSTSLFRAQTISRFAEHFQNTLESVIRDPDQKISDIQMLSVGEKQQLIADFNSTSTNCRLDMLVHKLFEEQVEMTPDAIAVSSGSEKISFRELNDSANSLAFRLREDHGVVGNTLVGVQMDRSLEMIVGILGIMKAGGVYLPIDPNYPEERQRYMIEDSGVKLILASRVMDDLSGLKYIEVGVDDSGSYPCENLPDRFESNRLCYVIYTSGSTGRPKGITVSHRSLTNYLKWAEGAYCDEHTESFAFFTTLSFDLTVTSVFVPLLSGRRIELFKDGDLSELLESVAVDESIHAIKATPSHFQVLLGMDLSNSAIRKVVVGGEILKTDLASKIEAAFPCNVDIYNEYGPTEATVGCMIHRFDPCLDTGLEVPIGKPAANVNLYVVDESRSLTAIGVPGELAISGECISYGYLNRVELTAEKFVECPFESGRRMYRSGDLARWNASGVMEFLGRTDDQVKVRGHRIELAEVESEISRIGLIRRVAVLAKEIEGDQCLVAYCESDLNLDAPQVKDELMKRLPDYMVPDYYEFVETLPLTVNGKVDREGLANRPLELFSEVNYAPPSNETEHSLVGIIQDLLNVERVGVDDDFFEMGGHSLKAAIAVSRINKRYQTGISIDDIFQRRTARNLSSLIDMRVAGSKIVVDSKDIDDTFVAI